MPRSTQLTEYEQGLITAYDRSGWSHRKIAKEIGRSQNVVSCFLRDSPSYATKKSSGRPKTVNPRVKRRLFRDISNSGQSISQVIFNNNFQCSRQSCWRAMTASGGFCFSKMKQEPAFKQRHKDDRFHWALDKLNWKDQWKNIFFSDEKKWNLDGPDGCKFYWRNAKQAEECCRKRQFGGGSLMTWAAFSFTTKSKLVFIDGRMDSAKYIQMIKDDMLPLLKEGEIFQQDNAPIHVSQLSKQFFNDNKVQLLGWPALSPDINPIENLWAIMVRQVYGQGKQYLNKTELKTALKAAWENIAASTMESLVNSMPKRCVQVVQRKGSLSDY